MTRERRRRALACIISLGMLVGAQAQSLNEFTNPGQQYKTILRSFQTAAYSYHQNATDEEREEITARIAALTSSCLELVAQHPRESFALEALTQVVTQEYWLDNYTSHPGWGKESRQAKAIALILRDHLHSDRLGPACKRVHFGFRQECETFLRTVLEKNPHREVQALACLRLAQYLAGRLARLDLLEEQPSLARRYEGLYGRDYLDNLRKQDRAKGIRDAEAFYQRAITDYGDVKMAYGEVVGETAERELFEIRHLSIGKPAPEIEGRDQDDRQFKLSEYRGKVVLLYFWTEF